MRKTLALFRKSVSFRFSLHIECRKLANAMNESRELRKLKCDECKMLLKKDLNQKTGKRRQKGKYFQPLSEKKRSENMRKTGFYSEMKRQ